MWYVIHTMAGQEDKCRLQCEKYVEKDSYQEIFIPQYTVHKHFRKEWHELQKVLFPGYLFVDTAEIDRVIEGLRGFRQYTKVLRDGELISPIAQQEQDFLMTMMDQKHIVGHSEGFLIGEKVCITSGPLRNCQGYVRSVDRHRRIAKMEIPVFGRMTPVEVGFSAIARVSVEEFRQMVEENKQAHPKRDRLEPGQVLVQKGTFAGMTGKFLYADVDRDEWTVELQLFGTGTKVMFQREEIKMSD